MKLFDNEETIPEILTIDDKLKGDNPSEIAEIITEYNNDMVIASEGFLRAYNELSIIGDIKTSLESKKLSSIEYFTSIENYNLYLKSIANNLGINIKLPSMEDFKNPYGIETSHKIVLEGFTDFMRSVWEKIKEFFKAFFKKVMLFLKRLVNANLDLEEYEEYIASVINQAKRSKKDNVNPVIIQSKLPLLLADPDLERINVNHILLKGLDKLSRLLDLNTTIFEKYMAKFINELESNENDLINLLENVQNLSLSKLEESIIDIRYKFIKNINTNIFTNIINDNISTLPDSVYEKIITDSDSRPEDVLISSIVEYRKLNETLPKNFNIFLISSSIDNNGLKTNKIFITGHTETNTYIKSDIETIANLNNLIKSYDFYKKYSKNFNIRNTLIKMNDLENTINNMLNKFDKKFTNIALESSGQEDPLFVNPDGSDFNPDYFNSSSNINNEEKEHKKKLIEEFERFIFNYLNNIQVLTKEISINLVGTYSECRYELIRYIYLSAKVFS